METPIAQSSAHLFEISSWPGSTRARLHRFDGRPRMTVAWLLRVIFLDSRHVWPAALWCLIQQWAVDGAQRHHDIRASAERVLEGLGVTLSDCRAG